MKRLIALMLVLVMAMSMAVACDKTEAPVTDAPADGNTDNNTTPPSEEEAPPIIPTSLKIKGTDISEYTIVYAYNPDRAVYAQYPSLVTQDTEYDKQTAENLAALIKTHFGATVKVVRDEEQPKGNKEIIIGSTNRGLVDTLLSSFSSVKDYVFRENNGKIVICGNSYGATWHAAEDFIANVLAQNAEQANVNSGYLVRAKANMLVVGCIGDSLTNGSKPSGYTSSVSDSIRRDIVAYPAVLQRIAWKDMVVYNYGLGGRTMITDFKWDENNDGVPETNHAWTACNYYQPCMNNAPNIDLALIMLGTNDSNEARATKAGHDFGTASYKKTFIDSCEEIVNDLRAKNGNMRIALLNCPIAYNSFEDAMSTYIRGYQKAAATKLGLDHLNMFKETQKSFDIVYPDGLHPDDQGYTRYAQIINGLIDPIVKEMLGK
ncbi:MAG: SGNH/GDSL hydrolase family protein [Ruminococcaceae bacterium]|nr:SGNH/GDSL hydrolase family protein [Oscillospiraceae bacterium]